jgi:hypothetical protein
MMRTLLAALAVLLMVVPVQAASIGAQSGAARDWVRTTTDGDWEELGTFQAGLSIDTVLDEEGFRGLTFGIRMTDDTNIQQYLVEYWTVTDALEWFVGVNGDVWEQEITGSTEFLGGGRAGVRLDAAGIPFEASGHYSGGSDGKGHVGIFLGLRFVEELL